MVETTKRDVEMLDNHSPYGTLTSEDAESMAGVRRLWFEPSERRSPPRVLAGSGHVGPFEWRLVLVRVPALACGFRAGCYVVSLWSWTFALRGSRPW